MSKILDTSNDYSKQELETLGQLELTSIFMNVYLEEQVKEPSYWMEDLYYNKGENNE